MIINQLSVKFKNQMNLAQLMLIYTFNKQYMYNNNIRKSERFNKLNMKTTKKYKILCFQCMKMKENWILDERTKSMICSECM